MISPTVQTPNFSPRLYPQPVYSLPVLQSQPQLKSSGVTEAAEETASNNLKHKLTHLGIAAGLFGAGLAMRKLPLTPTKGFKYFSTDWKEWTKIALGILTVGEVNKAFDWRPQPWVSALQSLVTINALIAPRAWKSVGQTAVLAPLIAGLVQGSHEIDKRLSPVLEEKLDVPPLATRLALSAASVVLGVNAFPPLYRATASTGILGKQAQTDSVKTATSALMGTEVAVCSRGCCRAVVCLNEVADFLGASVSWLKNQVEHN